jgi:hypothetical protein
LTPESRFLDDVADDLSNVFAAVDSPDDARITSQKRLDELTNSISIGEAGPTARLKHLVARVHRPVLRNEEV